MKSYVKVGNLQIAKELFEFVNNEALPGSRCDQGQFWDGLEAIIKDLTPKNRALLAERDELQKKINAWHRENKEFNFNRYKEFLKDIGYLEPEVEDFKITTKNVDDEVALKLVRNW